MSIIGHKIEPLNTVLGAGSSISKFRGFSALQTGVKDGLKGSLFNIPFIAYEVGTAQRGEQSATLAGKGTGLLAYPALAGVAAAGVAMIPGVNVVAAAVVGSILAMYPASLLEDSITKKVKWLSQTGKNIRHLEVGGRYVDTDYAKHTRQMALMELSSAGPASRRYLGNEALISHR